ncbi:MAG: class I SAM-dependent methyltransferase [Candidatus Omnitrophota bacterium]
MTYQKVYDQYLTAGFKEMNQDFARRAQDYETIYAQHLPDNKGARILDIGCGMGNFLYYLKNKGYTNFHGIDIGKEAIEFCQANVTNEVTQITDLSNYLKAHQGEFDMVTMNDVIEHIPKNQTIEVLESLRDSLKREGTLFIVTGNIATLYGGFLRYIGFDHEIAYSEFSLRQVLTVTGFKDIQIFGNKNRLRPNIKRILWVWSQLLWFKILKLIYVIEVGTDAPKIISKLLIAVARKG